MSIVRPPDCCYIYHDGKIELRSPRQNQKELVVSFEPTADKKGIEVLVYAENTYLRLLRLRWNFTASEELTLQNGFDSVRVFSEGGSGLISSAFHGIEPDAAMPFYFYVTNGSDLAFRHGRLPKKKTYAFGVKTSPSAYPFWQLDSFGVTLWLDFRCGGNDLHICCRKIHAAVILNESYENISTYNSAKLFSKEMCRKKLPVYGVVYGTEHTLYGEENVAVKSAKENILALQRMTNSLAFEPHMILKNPQKILPINKLKTLVSYIKAHKAIPGYIYCPDGNNNIRYLRRCDGHSVPDISNPDVCNTIYNDLKNIIYAGFRFIGIDFDSFDLFGKVPGLFSVMTPDTDYRLYNEKKTSAEVTREFFHGIRTLFDKECDKLGGNINFCILNAVPHLCCESANLLGTRAKYEKYDYVTSVKKIAGSLIPALMGNSQTGNFLAEIPFSIPSSARELTYRYINLIAKSGIAFISAFDINYSSGPQSRDLSHEFSTVCTLNNELVPLDFTETVFPVRWIHHDREFTFYSSPEEGFDYCGEWNL